MHSRPLRLALSIAGVSMIGFSPSTTQTAHRAAFRDAASASAWLAAQARARLEISAMLSELTAQIEAFSLQDISPRGRFKTLEVLRKAVFAASTDCRNRCEGQPLPLAADDRAVLDAACRLWRSYAVGYQQCLQACLDGDVSLSKHAARVAHRVSFCLRVEQLTGYAGGVAPRSGFWKSFHALFLAAERLGCATETMEDRLLGETRASSISGQYAMALMLYLAQPFSFSSEQLTALVRWLARWREHVRIGEQVNSDGRYSPILLNLAVDLPIHEGEEGEALLPRWLSLGNVQRKIRQRIEALAAGESPESLKLGHSLSAENCKALLGTLAANLRRPPPVLFTAMDGMPELSVGSGLTVIHRLLGGKGLDEAPLPDAFTDAPPTKDQQAMSEPVVHQAGLERWFLAHRENKELVLLRRPEDGTSRLALHGLLAVGQREDDYLLAEITGLWQSDDGNFYCAINLFPGDVTPRVAEIRNWITGDVVRHPAFQLSAEKDSAQELLLLPAGLLVRASGVRFFDNTGQLLFGLRVVDCLERSDEIEFWRVASDD
jgi:hypothetical protein